MENPVPLAVARRPRVRLALGAALLAVVVGAVVWFVNSPAALATSDDPIQASTPAGSPVYLGVFSTGTAFDRSLDLSGVRVRVEAEAPVEVEPLLCRRGAIRVTTDPQAFCEELVGTEGVTVSAGDTLVLRVLGEQPGAVLIDRVRLVFSEGIQRGVRSAGAPSRVAVLGR